MQMWQHALYVFNQKMSPGEISQFQQFGWDDFLQATILASNPTHPA
jgi:hypothetical protein